jgi:hypothetical protein
MKMEVFDTDMRYFVCASTGVIEEQKQRVISEPIPGRSIGSRQQRIDLMLLQIADGDRSRSFRFDSADMSAPSHVFRATLRDEAGKSMHSCQALVSTGDATDRPLESSDGGYPIRLANSWVDPKPSNATLNCAVALPWTYLASKPRSNSACFTLQDVADRSRRPRRRTLNSPGRKPGQANRGKDRKAS